MRDQIDDEFVVLVENNSVVDREKMPSHTHVETRFVSSTPARKNSRALRNGPKNLKSPKAC
jgi:hypothetical protein